jgi:hypothetical protein
VLNLEVKYYIIKLIVFPSYNTELMENVKYVNNFWFVRINGLNIRYSSYGMFNNVIQLIDNWIDQN